MRKRLVLLVILGAIAAGATWAVAHFTAIRRNYRQQAAVDLSNASNSASYTWAEAVEKVKAQRADAGGPVETPPELRHYSDRRWFLATQLAEVARHNVPTCQDFVDLAAMIERGELVSLPAVTDTYVLYGVGAKADESAFSRYQEEHSIQLLGATELADAYRRLDEQRAKVESRIASLKVQTVRRAGSRGRSASGKLEQELNAIAKEKADLDQFYGKPEKREKLLHEYESLRALAKNFGGRAFNLDEPSDREAMKVNMLSSLRPVALKILEQVASAYRRQFDRPLPVSSLVRPEQYQRKLSRSNRNAVRIDTPPHSTGLAFDIDYRYMSAAEQTFLMAELARLKNEGRIEVIRESNANYHVFAFINGNRPSDGLIAASLDEAQAPVEAHHAVSKPTKVKSRSTKARKRTVRSRPRKHRR